MKATVLLVEGDPDLCCALRARLEEEEVAVTEADSGIRALALSELHRPDLAIVDLALPDMSGIEFCDKMHRVCDAPTLLLGVMLPEEREMAGLRPSISDYVPKPFDNTEVVVRALRLLRGSRPRNEGGKAVQQGRLLTLGDICLDLRTHRVSVGRREIKLRPTEVKLLRTLMERSPRVVSPEALVQQLWPEGAQDYAALGDAILALRDALEDDPLQPRRIKHVPEYGYKLEAVAEPRLDRGGGNRNDDSNAGAYPAATSTSL